MIKNTLYILLFALIGCQSGRFQLAHITVNHLEKPLEVPLDQLVFGWQLVDAVKQTAYEIEVSQNGQMAWQSGKVTSSTSQLVRYAGKPLQPNQYYDLVVKVWNENGKEALAKAGFRTAPAVLNAHWIGAIRREEAFLPKGRNWHAPSLKKYRAKYDSIPELAKRSIMLRKEISISKNLKSATLHISGLGHYELALDGEKIGNSQFAPLWTDYDKTLYFNTFDLTNSLKEGKHAFGVLLGNGMYNAVGDRYRKFWVSFGPPTLFFQLQLDFEDGTSEIIQSDSSWKYALSPITFNDIFGGEDYDASLEQPGWNTAEFDDGAWQPVVIQEAPKGKLIPQLAPEISIQQTFDFKSVIQRDTTTYVFDMGQNLAGFPMIRLSGKAGQTVKLIVGERLGADSLVTQKNTGGPHFYQYTLKGGGEEVWQPRFSYYGYQYIQVEGVQFGENQNADWPILKDIKSHFVYADAAQIGSFECSNPIFTQTHTLINNAIKSNMQAVFTDCPHREKLGWIEEIYLNGPGLLYNYDLTQLFRKEMQDMADAQRSNGLVPNIAPEYVDFSQESWGADFTDSPEWGAAAVMVPWMYFEFYGDDSLIREYYQVMRGFVDYLSSRADSGIVSHGLGDWYDYGDHAAGYSKNSPIALSATAHYYLCAERVAQAAALIGNEPDQKKYHQLAQDIRDAFNQIFFNPETNQYGTGSQFSNAVAIYLGIVSVENKESVLSNLVADIKAHGNRLTTGDVGNRYLFQTLAENGLNDLLYTMLNHYEAPGYGYQLQYGLTTLTEQWNPTKGNSWNHFMMGQIEEWFFKTLAGIQSDPEKPGFQHFIIAPQVVGDLTFVKAKTASLYGEIAVEWSIEDGKLRYNLAIPANSSATFIMPDFVETEEKNIELTAGKYEFEYSLNQPK